MQRWHPTSGGVACSLGGVLAGYNGDVERCSPELRDSWAPVTDEVGAQALRRKADARRLFGDLLDAVGSELDEEEALALAVALTGQVRRERAAR